MIRQTVGAIATYEASTKARQARCHGWLADWSSLKQLAGEWRRADCALDMTALVDTVAR